MGRGLVFNNGKLLRNVLNTASNQSKTLRHTSLGTGPHYYLYLLLKNMVILVTSGLPCCPMGFSLSFCTAGLAEEVASGKYEY